MLGLLILSLAFASANVVSTPNIWIANSNDNSVTKLSSSGGLVGTYSVGHFPFGVAVDASGNVWVTNANSNSVTKLSSSGVVVGTYSVGSNPNKVAVDASGNVWIANFYSNSVTKLSSSGGLVGTYSVGTGPTGIAVDASGNVWVINYGSNSVTKLSSSGVVVGTYSVGTGPQGVAVDASGNVWIANTNSNSVTKLSSSGGLVGTYSVGSNPNGVAVDASGNVWIANSIDNNVTKLSSSGGLVGTYSVGTGPTSLGDFTGFALQYFVLGYSLPATCSDADTILKLSGATNAHGAIYSDTDASYATKICYSSIFGSAYSGANPRVTDEQRSNWVLRLSSTTNAHAGFDKTWLCTSGPSGQSGAFCAMENGWDIFYGDLNCTARIGKANVNNCLTGENCVVKLSNWTNAHLELCSQTNYNVSICCKSGGAPPVPSIHGVCSGTGNTAKCIATSGAGANECLVDTDCRPNPTHKVCSGTTCASVNGEGNDECSSNAQCIPNDNKHLACNGNKQCVLADGEGTNLCVNDAGCSVLSHLDCLLDGSCSFVVGEGPDICSGAEQCTQNPVHSECVGTGDTAQCKQISGQGVDECDVDTDCRTTLTHKECSGTTCASVNGEGNDECSSNAQCDPTKHTECNNNKQCVLVNGAGNSQCAVDDDCNIPTHLDCLLLGKECANILDSVFGIPDNCLNDGDCGGPPPTGLPTAVITSPLDNALVLNGTSVAFSEDSTPDGLTLAWDIGNGSIISVSSFTHVFKSPGAKEITLTVTNASGSSDSMRITIYVIANNSIIPIIEKPEDGKVIMNDSRTVEYSGKESYVLQVTGVVDSNCGFTLNCLGGNCPSTANILGCLNNPKDIATGQRGNYSAMLYKWDFGDDGSGVSGYGPGFANGTRKFPISLLGENTIELILSYTKGGIALEDSTQAVFWLFNKRQCSADGKTWYKISNDMVIVEEYNTRKGTDNPYCAGKDTTPGTRDDCCPPSHICMSGGCQAIASDKTICKDYGSQTECENDENTNNFAQRSFEAKYSHCDSGIVTENGKDYIVDCSCAWNNSKAPEDRCFLSFTKTSADNPILLPVICNYDNCDEEGNCEDYTYTYSCLNNDPSCPPINLGAGEGCGKPSIELPFFGAVEFVIAFMITALVYLILHGRKQINQKVLACTSA